MRSAPPLSWLGLQLGGSRAEPKLTLQATAPKPAANRARDASTAKDTEGYLGHSCRKGNYKCMAALLFRTAVCI